MTIPVHFINKRRVGGYKFKNTKLVPRKPDAKLETIIYNKKIMLDYLDFSIKVYTPYEIRLEEQALEFSNIFGALRSEEDTHWYDFTLLASAMERVHRKGRQEIEARTELEPTFSMSVVDIPNNNGQLVAAIEPDSLRDAIWFDFLVSGTQGFQQCKYVTTFNEKYHSCENWLIEDGTRRIWCSDACRLAAYRRHLKGDEGKRIRRNKE
jgi:hypothetical protein